MPAKNRFQRIPRVTVTREKSDTVKIQLDTPGPPTALKIYMGEHPDTIEFKTAVAGLSNTTDVRIEGLEPDIRYYFALVSPTFSRVICSERRLKLKGSVNFRDLGGYLTAAGRQVKWGRVFRSDNFARVTRRDLVILQRLGLKKVIDFRSQAEVDQSPNLFLGNSSEAYLHCPIQRGESDPTVAFERLKRGDYGWLTLDYMVEAYIEYIEVFAHIWADVFAQIADSANHPLVFHCTAGKDRAGTCAALILLALGVPEETVLRDHGLSNIYIAEIAESINERLRAMGIDPDKISHYLSAPRECMQAQLNHLNKYYGGIDGYLTKKAGVSPKTLQAVRSQLLEETGLQYS